MAAWTLALPHQVGAGARVWSTFGPHAIGTERFATVSSDASLRRSQLRSCGNKPPWRTLMKMRSARRSVIDRPCRTGPPAAARVGPGPPGDDASDAGRRHRRAGRWIGLSGEIAADLLPEAGDSWAVDGGAAV
jgi:hypothetical protein